MDSKCPWQFFDPALDLEYPIPVPPTQPTLPLPRESSASQGTRPQTSQRTPVPDAFAQAQYDKEMEYYYKNHTIYRDAKKDYDRYLVTKAKLRDKIRATVLVQKAASLKTPKPVRERLSGLHEIANEAAQRRFQLLDGGQPEGIQRTSSSGMPMGVQIQNRQTWRAIEVQSENSNMRKSTASIRIVYTSNDFNNHCLADPINPDRQVWSWNPAIRCRKRFVHVFLDEIVFVRMPLGYEKQGKVLRLNKALYGFRRLFLLWQRKFTDVLRKLGFTETPQESCVVVRRGIIVFFVGDCVIAFTKDRRDEVMTATEGLAKESLRLAKIFQKLSQAVQWSNQHQQR